MLDILRAEGIFSQVLNLDWLFNETIPPEVHLDNHAPFDLDQAEGAEYLPHAVYLQPILQSLQPQSPIAGVLVGVIPLDRYVLKALPTVSNGNITFAVVQNDCGQSFTFRISGEEPVS